MSMDGQSAQWQFQAHGFGGLVLWGMEEAEFLEREQGKGPFCGQGNVQRPQGRGSSGCVRLIIRLMFRC